MRKPTQKQKLLRALQDAGDIGVNSFHARQIAGLQAPVRIQELEEMGYIITSTPEPDRSTTYRLVDVPLDKKPYRWEIIDGYARKVYL